VDVGAGVVVGLDFEGDEVDLGGDWLDLEGDEVDLDRDGLDLDEEEESGFACPLCVRVGGPPLAVWFEEDAFEGSWPVFDFDFVDPPPADPPELPGLPPRAPFVSCACDFCDPWPFGGLLVWSPRGGASAVEPGSRVASDPVVAPPSVDPPLPEPPQPARTTSANAVATVIATAEFLERGTRNTVEHWVGPVGSDSLAAMYCPRCGAENDEGSRYCASCGSALPRDDAGKRPPSEDDADSTSSTPAKAGAGSGGLAATLGRIIGTTRKARLVSAGIAVAIVVAIVAFIALGSDDEKTVPQDGLTKAMDANCVHHKVTIAKAQAEALNGGNLAAVSTYADSMVAMAGEWRMQLGRLDVPADRAELVEGLEAALLEVQIEAGTLARSAREGDKAEIAVSAGRVDGATAKVEDAVHELELERCSELVFSAGRLIRE